MAIERRQNEVSGKGENRKAKWSRGQEGRVEEEVWKKVTKDL